MTATWNGASMARGTFAAPTAVAFGFRVRCLHDVLTSAGAHTSGE